jgi:hypothetical protein
MRRPVAVAEATLTRGRLALADAALNMSYVQLFKIEVYDHLVDRPEVRSMFLPFGPLSSPPALLYSFSRSVLAARQRTLTRRRRQSSFRTPKRRRHTLIAIVLVTALGGAARRG